MSNSPRPAPTVPLKERRKRIIKLFRYLVFDFAMEELQRKALGTKYVSRRAEARNRKRAQRFVKTALELGGVLIKLGQYLSARFDLLPEVWIEELARLQDNVPPVDFSELQPIIEQDLGGRLENLFLEINRQPLASASLGQVHEARLLDGTRVAVKVRRPGIDVIIEADLEALNRVIDFLGRRTDLGKLADLKGIAREFEITLRRELDYVKEGRSAERFKTNLQKLKYIYVPVIYWERSATRVLTTEFIEGVKVTNYAEIEMAGLDRDKAARVLANCYLNQLLIDGFFHADPHPGNIFVRGGPYGLQVVFIDFGMVGEIPGEMRAQLRRMIVGFLNRDIETILQTFRALGFIRREEDVDKVRIGLSYAMDRFMGRNLGEIKAMDKRKIFEELSYIIYSQPLYIPGDIAFLSRAFETLLGICTGLSQKLDFVAEARPFMQRLAAEELGSAEAVKAYENLTNLSRTLRFLPGGTTVAAFFRSPAGEELVANALQLTRLPRSLNQTLERLESGRLQVQVYSDETKRAAEQARKGNERLVSSILAGSLLVSGVSLTTASGPLWAALVCFAGAFLMGLRLLR